MGRKLLTGMLLAVLCPFFYLQAFRGVSENARPKTHMVQIVRMQFIPAVLSVNKGDSVVFLNKDLVNHNATERTAGKWQSPTLRPGDSWRMVVTSSADYYCTFHPGMKGKLEVARATAKTRKKK
ncbi:plastocyanin/azurin family copper-binding protein [Adhaeribacter soli]|uniref:Plastocyanin n=1 Tax=Adhaeribacter soli TaxID=2607655 RepID=A0A5N1ISU8_9BACT|nr:plastocyanin/azurin family copper-binding protein [Adhaeribacter soli]KAA9332738.1 plastocyanin [Adhaeribacter soli]